MLIVCFLLLMTCLFAKHHKRLGKVFLTFCLTFAMATQWALLWLDGLFSVQTAMPFHLCGLMAILSISLLWKQNPLLWSLCVLLGVPCAVLALLFPAVAMSSHPLLMKSAFILLHGSIVCVPLLLILCGQPMATDPQRAMFWINVFLLFVSLFNAVFDSNYLFLRFAPANTPLALLEAQGRWFYVSSLEMLCLIATLWLSHFYGHRLSSKSS